MVLFQWRDDEDRMRNMVGTVFPGDDGEFTQPDGLVSVFDVDELAKGNIGFAQGNSWRGDHFEYELVAAIKQRQDERDKALAFLGSVK